MSFMYATKRDSPIQTNKTTQKKHVQTTNVVPVYPSGSNAYLGVIQRLVYKGNPIDFNNSETEATIRSKLSENDMITTGKLDSYFNLDRKEKPDRTCIVDACYKFAKEHMTGDKFRNWSFSSYSKVASAILSQYKKHLEAERNVSANTEESKTTSANTKEFKASILPIILPMLTYGYQLVGSLSLQKFSNAITADPLFMQIREEQERIKETNEIDIPKSIPESIPKDQLRYGNFYSQTAIQDEVKKYLIKVGAEQASKAQASKARASKAQASKARASQEQASQEQASQEQVKKKEGHRKDSLYKPNLLAELEPVYYEHSQHHIEPLSALTRKGKTSQKEQWQLNNLVLGPLNIRRIYEPDDMYDYEAAYVYENSGAKTDVEMNNIEYNNAMTIESEAAAMRTDYLQYFYHSCCKYYECMTSTNENTKRGAPTDLLPTARIAFHRFTQVETLHHADTELINSLKVFIDKFHKASKKNDIAQQIAQQIYATREIIGKILEYGRREDSKTALPVPDTSSSKE